jgi:putative oxidoreductase
MDRIEEVRGPRALAVLRIVTAYLFMTHGTAKLFGVPYQKMFDGLQLMKYAGDT